MREKIRSIFDWLWSKFTWRRVRRIIYALVGIIFLYYLIGMVIVENINSDKNFASKSLAGSASGSHTVNVAAALIDREVNKHSWVPNDPWFKPGALLDNMPNYQRGIIAAISIFSVELKDQLGRTRGSSQADVDLKEFTGSINYVPDRWIIDFRVSLWPTAPTERQYNNALTHLKTYNDRLAKGDAIFERRADNLMAVLDKIALDLGSSSDSIARKIDDGIGCVLDTKADDLFYDVKGRTYAYWILLKGLRADFDKVIKDRDIGNSWNLLEKSLSALIDLDPMIVSNCDADDFLFQNHLAAQGFYLLRARTQLREITNILLK